MEIFNEKSRYALQEHLDLITAPLQVIWGKQDQVMCNAPLIVTQQSLNTEVINCQLGKLNRNPSDCN